MHIIITEQQLGLMKRIVESESLMLNNGDVEEYGDNSKVSNGATITKPNGEEEYSEPTYADIVAATLANNDPRYTVINRFY